MISENQWDIAVWKYRAYRVVRYIQHTIDVSEMKNEFVTLEQNIGNITNILNHEPKTPFNLFYLDLKPAKNDNW